MSCIISIEILHRDKMGFYSHVFYQWAKILEKIAMSIQLLRTFLCNFVFWMIFLLSHQSIDKIS